MKTKTQKLPKWFEGTRYSNGETVTNPFSEKSYELNNLELSMYDFIKGSEYTIELMGGVFNGKTFDQQDLMRKGLDWFRKNNAKAYMVLLD
jgi:hypothetical protein